MTSCRAPRASHSRSSEIFVEVIDRVPFDFRRGLRARPASFERRPFALSRATSYFPSAVRIRFAVTQIAGDGFCVALKFLGGSHRCASTSAMWSVRIGFPWRLSRPCDLHQAARVIGDDVIRAGLGGGGAFHLAHRGGNHRELRRERAAETAARLRLRHLDQFQPAHVGRAVRAAAFFSPSSRRPWQPS